MAEAAGLLGLTAERPDEVRPMVARAFAHDGPAQAAVVSERGDEIVDLARTNLWRWRRKGRPPRPRPANCP